MSYSIELRERTIAFIRGGGTATEATILFHIGRTTLQRWCKTLELRPYRPKERRRKLDKTALQAHVRDYPNALLRERAAHFGVSIHAIWVALQKFKVSEKNDPTR